MHEKRVVLFDALGTLVYDPFYVEVPAFFGMTLDELMRVKHKHAWIDFELGEIGEDEFLRKFFADERAFDGAGLKQCMADAFRWLAGMDALVAELQTAGVPMHVLSNYPRWYQLIENKLGLARYVGRSFVSYAIGARKPDAAAYQHVLTALAIDANQVVFVDDRAANCGAAQALGLTAIEMTDASALRAALQRLGLLQPASERGQR